MIQVRHDRHCNLSSNYLHSSNLFYQACIYDCLHSYSVIICICSYMAQCNLVTQYNYECSRLSEAIKWANLEPM